ncbi:MAG: SAM-dependent methyltransferase [Gammaproteobacteria bacterium]|nr:MAG: SAM-dependent methyltransferase [Gammaproteobacteria bacterium]
MPPPNDLPVPGTDEQSVSAALTERLRDEIEASGGAIDFARFMERALYEPGLGYYSGGRRKFGAAGDFVTAPEMGSLFADCLARPCAQILQATNGDILEAGAGSGVLAADLLLALEKLGTLPANYFILELSAELRARQRETLGRKAPHLVARVRWLDALPAKGFRGVALGNELLDAMPVERFRMTAWGLKQLQVGWTNNRFADGNEARAAGQGWPVCGFVWHERTADRTVQERMGPICLPEGYISEIGFQAEAWVHSIADMLEQGVLLLIDYGFPRAEFYHAQRRAGTLMCHYRQRAHDDPLILVGLQDITAHVDFSAIAHAGQEAGLDLLGYTSQAAFLLDNGLEEIIAASDPNDVRAHLALTSQIKKLTLPHEMGELFKVIALARGIGAPLAGFRQQDRRARL